eukprot:NODE_190_length_15503_cov_0.365814.p10 type:complete len:145 gc:universal NODE_190_length_15503_cov_0.365814:8742-8308(-)
MMLQVLLILTFAVPTVADTVAKPAIFEGLSLRAKDLYNSPAAIKVRNAASAFSVMRDVFSGTRALIWGSGFLTEEWLRHLVFRNKKGNSPGRETDKRVQARTPKNEEQPANSEPDAENTFPEFDIPRREIGHRFREQHRLNDFE